MNLLYSYEQNFFFFFFFFFFQIPETELSHEMLNFFMRIAHHVTTNLDIEKLDMILIDE